MPRNPASGGIHGLQRAICEFACSRAASALLIALSACGTASLRVPGDGAAPAEAAAGAESVDSSAESSGGAGPIDARAAGADTAIATACDAPVGAGSRVVTLVNDCPSQTIRVGMNGAYVQDCDAGGCPEGTTCDSTRSPPGCFWDFPAPSCGGSVLATGGSATYVLSAPAIAATAGGALIQWSGNVYAATGCARDGTECKTANCAMSSAGTTTVGPCPNGVGPQGPVTLAEFALAPNGADFYDISAINGVNVPVSIAPVGGAVDPSDPYTCGSPGAATPTGGLVACSWAFDTRIALAAGTTDESTFLRAVARGGNPCASDADCAGTEVCGTALDFTGSPSAPTCGQQIAWWTADELCASTGNTFGPPLDCNQAVAGQGTNASLYGCSGPENASSCYGTGAVATCCGCPSWTIAGQPVAVSSRFGCQSTNAQWLSIAEPWAAFVKNACPTAYSFPFDDATSTFACATPGPSAPNSVGYTITFCPAGLTGF